MRGVLIDYNDALRLVNDEIVKEGPDYVYKQVNFTCANVVKYSDDTIEGSCLVGRALISAGVDPERFITEHLVDADVFQVAWTLPELGLTRKAQAFLTRVQARQDEGEAWGEAVVKSLESVQHDFDDVEFI